MAFTRMIFAICLMQLVAVALSYQPLKTAKKSLLKSNNIMKSSVSNTAIVGSASAAATGTAGNLVAKALGYVMGIGAMSLYTPIALNLYKNKNADGFSTATWVYNIIGMGIACIYPYKKGFAISTYIELIALVVQSVGILGLISFYQNKMNEFYVLTAVLAAIGGFLYKVTIPTKILNGLQVASILLCNYANIPQILLTFKTKTAAWSIISALMSMGGNLIRVFTTIQLNKGDPLILNGYLLGFLTNSILFAQTLIYPKPK